MAEKRVQILVMRGEESPIRQIDVSSRRVRYAAALTAGFLVVLTSLVTLVALDGSARVRAQLLAQENAILTDEVEAIQTQVSALESTLGSLANEGDAFRLLAGLEQLDEEVLQVGVGGPGLPTLESTELWALDPAVGELTFATSYDMLALERRASLLSESLVEATETLSGRNDLLEATPSILPTAGLLSSGFSSARMHPIHHKELPHEGIDLTAPTGTAILAAAKGVVTFSGWMSGYGNLIEIDHGHGFKTRYGHASALIVKRGEQVARGELIAQVGETGVATAPHLHYEVIVDGKPRNPLNFVFANVIP